MDQKWKFYEFWNFLASEISSVSTQKCFLGFEKFFWELFFSKNWTIKTDITPIDSYKVETIDTVTFENSHLANLRDLDQNSNVNIHNQQNPNSEIPQPNTPGKGWYLKIWIFIENSNFSQNFAKFRKILEQCADWIILGSSGGGSLPGSEVKQEPTSQMDNKTHIECVVSFKIRFLWFWKFILRVRWF